MKKIAILGSSNAMKPQIIIETILEMNLLPDKEVILFTNNSEGKCVDFCEKKNIEVVIFKNERLEDDESIKLAKNHKIDLLVSAGWPYKIPLSFLESFKFTSINCHGSILPDYRGNRAYMHYWANCETYYGATIHYMNEEFDDGNIIIQGRMKLFVEETPQILHRRTAELCATLLPTAVLLIEQGFKGREVKGIKRYFKKISENEFELYRAYNLSAHRSQKKITPHITLK